MLPPQLSSRHEPSVGSLLGCHVHSAGDMGAFAMRAAS